METNTENTQKDAITDEVKVKENLQPQIIADNPLPKKSRKEDKQHKKDDKAIEQFMRTLNGLQTPEEKLAAVCKKYAEVVEENRKLQAVVKLSDKRFAVLSKEKEQLQLEYNRTVLVKSKLENLCRELQKQNKAVKDESLLKIREEEERRKETQAKFQSTLSEITTLLQQNNEKNTKLRDDNISMTKKFKTVVEQYELREQQIEKMAKQMQLEQQLADAKLAKANLEATAEKERMLAEMSQLKLEMTQYAARLTESRGAETALRGQVAMYTDKYDEFQNALVKSNQVFGGFKGEMEKMSKKILKLEKESLSWKKRWEGSQTALLDMAADRQLADERAQVADRQIAQLQRLCRTMQGERTLLLNTLKEHNIERPPLQQLPPPPAPIPPAPSSISKVDAMAANCAQLKQSLAQLQTQLNVLTTKNGTEETGATKPDVPSTKSKKGRGKRNKAEKEAQKENIQVPPSVGADDVDPTTSTVLTNVSPVVECDIKTDVFADTVNDVSSVFSDTVNDVSSPLTKENVDADLVVNTENIAANKLEEIIVPTVVSTENVPSNNNSAVSSPISEVELKQADVKTVLTDLSKSNESCIEENADPILPEQVDKKLIEHTSVSTAPVSNNVQNGSEMPVESNVSVTEVSEVKTSNSQSAVTS